MKNISWIHVLLLVAGLTLLAGCGGGNGGDETAEPAETATEEQAPAESETAPTETASLQGILWVVEDIDGSGIVDDSRVTVQFDAEGRVSGRASCNQFNGSYTVEGQNLSFAEEMATTKMACPPAIMDQEDRFLAVLQKVTTYEIQPTGALVLKTAEGQTLRAFPEE